MLPRVVLLLPLLALACQAEPAELEPTSTVAPPVITSPADTPKPAELAELQPPPIDELEPPPIEPMPEPTIEPEPPRDEPAAELPTGPEPGTPESDAELLALLDDSTLTQEEFAKAFGNDKDPKVDDEGQFSLDPGERGRSSIGIGAATLSTGKAKPADLEALARADLHDFEVCHAMALSKDPKALGPVTLTIQLGSQGTVEHVEVESKLGSSLRDCLASVAETWTLAGAGKATLKLPLNLSTQ